MNQESARAALELAQANLKQAEEERRPILTAFQIARDAVASNTKCSDEQKEKSVAIFNRTLAARDAATEKWERCQAEVEKATEALKDAVDGVDHTIIAPPPMAVQPPPKKPRLVLMPTVSTLVPPEPELVPVPEPAPIPVPKKEPLPPPTLENLFAMLVKLDAKLTDMVSHLGKLDAKVADLAERIK